MTEECKILVKDKKLASYRVLQYVGTYHKKEIAKLLGMSRPTLYQRLKQHDWRMAELKLIEKHLP